MRVLKIETIGSYSLITEAAHITRGKDSDTNTRPSLETFEKWIISEHSPLRRVQVAVTISAQPHVIAHFTRHVHALHYVQTSRPDITGIPRDDKEKLYLLQANLQEWLQIARARMCNTASKDTQNLMYMIKYAFREHDEYLNMLAYYMIPKCEHLGRCNEPWNSCGLYKFKTFYGERWYEE